MSYSGLKVYTCKCVYIIFIYNCNLLLQVSVNSPLVPGDHESSNSSTFKKGTFIGMQV